MKKSIPELSIDSQLLYKRITQAGEGETVTYKELTSLIDRNVQKEGRGFLNTAVKMARREDRKVFEAVIGIGMKCLTDEEVANSIGKAAVKKIRNATTTATSKILTIEEYDKLPNEAKVNHNLSLSVLGVLRHISAPKKVSKIEAAIKESNQELPINKTLDFFKNA